MLADIVALGEFNLLETLDGKKTENGLSSETFYVVALGNLYLWRLG